MTHGFDEGRLTRIEKHFSAYVSDGRLTGFQLAVARGDDIVHTAVHGLRDREAGLPVEEDTIWRIASMTKPLTSVTAMTLWEEGVFELTDPISRWIPSFERVRVYQKGPANGVVTEPAIEPIRVWHLLSHTSGLTAGFIQTHVADALYRQAGYELDFPADKTLADCVDEWAALPLRFQPGTAWGYGVSTDVLGRLIEIWTGQSLAEAMRARVTGPLGMDDTVWHVEGAQVARLAKLYMKHPQTGLAAEMTVPLLAGTSRPTAFSGGGGLLSTTSDYLRFTRMLVNGGEYDGVRILAPRTLGLMTKNHLGGELSEWSTGGFAETTFEGIGFGLGFAIVLDPVPGRSASSPGEFYWGGAASTAFWVDPLTGVSAVFMTQLLPSGSHPIRPQLRQLVYSAMVS